MSDETGHDLAQAFKLHKRVDYLLPIIYSLELSQWTTPLIKNFPVSFPVGYKMLASPECAAITRLQQLSPPLPLTEE